MSRLFLLIALAALIVIPSASMAEDSGHVRYRINEPTGWTLTPNVNELPLDTTVYNHPLGGRLAIRLVYGASDLQSEMILMRQLVKEGDVEMIGEPLWDQTTRTVSVAWQKTLDGKIVMKGGLLIGPPPNLKTPLLLIYTGGWRPEMDGQLGPIFVRAFNERGLTPISQ